MGTARAALPASPAPRVSRGSSLHLTSFRGVEREGPRGAFTRFEVLGPRHFALVWVLGAVTSSCHTSSRSFACAVTLVSVLLFLTAALER